MFCKGSKITYYATQYFMLCSKCVVTEENDFSRLAFSILEQDRKDMISYGLSSLFSFFFLTLLTIIMKLYQVYKIRYFERRITHYYWLLKRRDIYTENDIEMSAAEVSGNTLDKS
jgi:hypothetical protein